MSKIPLTSKNEFKVATRYLQNTLTEKLGQDKKVALNIAQEAISRSMGFNDFQHYTNFLNIIGKPVKHNEIVSSHGDIAKEIQSLNYLIQVAKDDTDQAVYIRKALLHLYNPVWPIDIYKMNALDTDLSTALLNVFALNTKSKRDIHHYANEGQDVFRSWAEKELELRGHDHQREEPAVAKSPILDTLKLFCIRLGAIQGLYVGNGYKSFIKAVSNAWDKTDVPKGYNILLDHQQDFSMDGMYSHSFAIKSRNDDQHDVCVKFNVISGVLFVIDEPTFNDDCGTGLISNRKNPKYTDVSYTEWETKGNSDYFLEPSSRGDLIDLLDGML